MLCRHRWRRARLHPTGPLNPRPRCTLAALSHPPATQAPLAAGAAVILPAAGKFSASTFWQDATEHGMTFYTGEHTFYTGTHIPMLFDS